jgi:hypothetical protein
MIATIEKSPHLTRSQPAKNTLAERRIAAIDPQTGVNIGSKIAAQKDVRKDARKEFSREDKSISLELLKAYKRSPSQYIRTRLVNLNIGLVKKEVGYWVNQSSESYEDLLQVGSIGLDWRDRKI